MSENQSPQNQSESQPAHSSTAEQSQPFEGAGSDIPEAGISDGLSHMTVADESVGTGLSDGEFSADGFDADELGVDEFGVDESDADGFDVDESDADDEPTGTVALADGAAEDVEGELEDEASDTDLEAAVSPESSANRENELLSLIHDLNECNDALLMQVSKLENDLQQVKSEAVAEVEKASAAVQLAQEKMSRQVSAEQASAQQISQAAQQQVARLVGELDTVEQGLSRQVLVNENLKTELTEAQARIVQLERECALMADKHAEEVRSRVQAETASRDLRSRLQRQQRYTLQFKAALEKSLSTGVSSRAAAEIRAAEARSVPFTHQSVRQPVGVSMPRSQRIMPWAAGGNNSTAFQGIDPHLEALIRRCGKASTAEAAPAMTPKNAPDSAPASYQTAQTAQAVDATIEMVSPEAEARLWQDLARVMTTETAQETAQEMEQAEGTSVEAFATAEAFAAETGSESGQAESNQIESSQVESSRTESDQAESSQTVTSQIGAKPLGIKPLDINQSENASTDTKLAGVSASSEVAEQNRTELDRTELDRTGQNRTGQNTAEQDIAEHQVIQSDTVKKPPHLNWQAESRRIKLESEQRGSAQSAADVSTATSEEIRSQLANEPANESANELVDKAANEETQREVVQQVNLNNTALAEALAKAKQKAQLDSVSSAEVVFTEPSPWKKSISHSSASHSQASGQAVPGSTVLNQNRTVSSQPVTRQKAINPADYLPAIDSSSPSAVSPVAKPLHPQKRIGSFASVKLPTFPSARSGSFKR